MLIKIVLVCLIAVILNHAWRLLSFFGPSGHVHSHAPGPCRLVPGVDRGSEDMHLLKNGLVLISSGLYSFGLMQIMEEIKPGRLLLFDFKHPHTVEELQLPAMFDKQVLNPHGISVWQDPNSDVVTVFLVNHQDDFDRIEKFHLDLSTHKLTHIQSIVDADLIHINDLVAVDADSFYATMDMASRSPLGQKFDMYLMLKLGAVLFYDGKSTRTVVDGLFMPNGITLSNDAKYLYFAELGEHALRVYKRNALTNDLEFVQAYLTHTGVDNVIVDAAGDLWVGCHPHGYKMMNHMVNGSSPAPSQVLRFKTHDGRITSMSEVYSDDGHTIYGSSCAIYHDNQLLIGTVRHKLLLCDVKYLQ